MCQKKYNQVPPPQRWTNKIHFTLKKKGGGPKYVVISFSQSSEPT